MFEFILDNWDTIMAVLTAAHALALAIVNLTRTWKRQDGRTRRSYRAVEIAAGIIVPEKVKD